MNATPDAAEPTRGASRAEVVSLVADRPGDRLVIRPLIVIHVDAGGTCCLDCPALRVELVSRFPGVEVRRRCLRGQGRFCRSPHAGFFPVLA